jgi:hypothetical protein
MYDKAERTMVDRTDIWSNNWILWAGRIAGDGVLVCVLLREEDGGKVDDFEPMGCSTSGLNEGCSSEREWGTHLVRDQASESRTKARSRSVQWQRKSSGRERRQSTSTLTTRRA